MANQEKDPFKALTYMDLENWAGVKIVGRGKSYQRNRCVGELGKTDKGRLVAWVEGTQRYATVVYFQNGELESRCSCPYGYACKHAVAVLLEYLERVKKDRSIPLISPSDRCLALAEGEDFWDEEDDLTADESSPPPFDLKSHLKKMNKGELIKLLTQLAEANPEVSEALRFQTVIASNSVEKLVGTLRTEIERVTSEPAWWNSWRNEGEIPDYSRIQNGLQKLLDSGQADAVVELGDLLFRRGMDQIGQSDDEGETSSEIEACLPTVFQALIDCSLSDIDKMEKAVNFELDDSYSLCNSVGIFWEHDFDQNAWSDLADRLLARLDSLIPAYAGDFNVCYRRDQLTDFIMVALQEAGRSDEIIPLCRAEADTTQSYPRLVKQLLEVNRIEEAEDWIRKGYEATRDKWAGIASRLLDYLLKIKTKQKDWHLIAAIKADQFFDRPSLAAYQELEKAARKVACWPEVRRHVIQFLGKGLLPGIYEKDSSETSWPLPASGFPISVDKSSSSFPRLELLIEIAIHEKKPAEVVHWHELYNKQRKLNWLWSSDNLDDQVASAITDKYPDKAIAIWKELAENQIRLTKPKAYMQAARYLKKLKKLLEKSGRNKEWSQYLASIKDEHRRKRRLLEILSGFDDIPIVET